MSRILLLSLALFSVYGVIPSIVSRRLGVGVFREGCTSDGIAFTFDDGPDPIYTPKLLDLLKKHNIKATFFVLGSKAERFPHLIRRMHHEGHLIGVHNYVHRCNWFLTPRTVRQNLKHTVSIIEKTTGERPVFYRPPWGLLNIFDFFLVRKNYKIVLWSLMVGDWRSKGGSKRIEIKILDKLSPGALIVLHDSGETWGADEDAPLHMIKALESVFQEIHHRGWKCVRVDKMIGLSNRVEKSKVS
ncbi:peptidoglycan/xylan/chitin deacetylase (PgdA/CDA1 family) [Croceifilum oryzae]|uniref:Peptidoglycan/xylan/chitin deacetylase (PgdA/CDA1 family) n=1 Tax=Croceifilum oryzae TaxID=1553429 RepID=A0AAJ1WU22_9BACL|nr:polysaccharide deacetylase family protein [Croceifilum oryzae]MDQ0418618.1 peptidoglycan/xylan/chitin deacetylase (PgdA/CDA1 family) [Croceifilum oryzae]